MTGGRFSAVKGRERCQRTVSNPPSGIPPTTAQPPHARQCCSAIGGKEEKGGRVLPVNGGWGAEKVPCRSSAPIRCLDRSRPGSAPQITVAAWRRCAQSQGRPTF